MFDGFDFDYVHLFQSFVFSINIPSCDNPTENGFTHITTMTDTFRDVTFEYQHTDRPCIAYRTIHSNDSMIEFAERLLYHTDIILSNFAGPNLQSRQSTDAETTAATLPFLPITSLVFVLFVIKIRKVKP